MELRVLRYFLAVAREENITKAAALLHVTQPTLSRQLMQLEQELGVKLFRRSQYRIVLTEDGMLLRRRAQEILELADKAERELQHHDTELTGEIAIGCGESVAMTFLSAHIRAFRRQHPQVQFRIYSAIADDVKERIEKGLLDMGLLTEPVDIGRYAFLRIPQKDRWGVLVPKTHPLAQKNSVTPNDLLDIPLLMSGREIVRNELAGWFGDAYGRIEIAATFNLILNAANMVKNGVGAALCFDLGNLSDALTFCRFFQRWKPEPCWRGKKTRQPPQRREIFFLLSKIRFKHVCFFKIGIRHNKKSVIKYRYPKRMSVFFMFRSGPNDAARDK